MKANYEIHDKKTNEKLTGYHDGVGIFEFDRTNRPTQLYLTMGECVEVLGRIERVTGRIVGCREV